VSVNLDPIERRGRPPSALVLVLAAAFALAAMSQGIGAPFQKDAESQSAMWIASVAHGHLLTPRDYYGHLVEKPPLFYWLSGAVAWAMGGVNETRSRLVSLVAAAAIAIEILVWTIEYVGAAEGWLAFVFLVATYGFASRATLALTDMLMTFFVLSTLLILFPQLEGRASTRRALAAAGVLQLGMMTKGPVAIILVALSVFTYELLQRRNPLSLLRQRWMWLIIAPVTILTLGWYAFWFTFGSPHEFVIFMGENFGHFLPAAAGGTGEAARPLWYIGAKMIGGSLPMVALVPVAIAALMTGEISAARRRPVLMQASLVIVVLVFFSLASAKRDDYILPALPGLAVLSASVFVLDRPAAARGAIAQRMRNVVVGGIAIAMLGVMIFTVAAAWMKPALPVKMQSSDADLAGLFRTDVRAWRFSFIVCGLTIVAAAAVALDALRRKAAVRAGTAVGILGLAGTLVVTAVVRPQLAWLRSTRVFAAEIHAMIGEKPIFVVDAVDDGFSYYYGRAVPPLIGLHSIPVPLGERLYLMATPHDLRELRRSFRTKLKLVRESDLISGDGAPALYDVGPLEAPPELRPGRRTATRSNGASPDPALTPRWAF
jgi:4-amino-4-deoxy-L-arabinose transferase-like glycosyltransferase